MAIVYVAIALMMLLLIIPDESSSTGEAVRGIAAWSVLGLVALMVVIAAVNHPRFLVPPALRKDPGEITRWLGNRRDDSNPRPRP